MLRKCEVEGASAQRIPKVQQRVIIQGIIKHLGVVPSFPKLYTSNLGHRRPASNEEQLGSWHSCQGCQSIATRSCLELAEWIQKYIRRRHINQINLGRKQHTCFQVNSMVASMYVQMATDTNKLTNSNCSNGFSVNTRILGKVRVLKKVLLWWPSLRIWPAFTTRFGSPINGPLFSLMYRFGVGQIWAPLQRLCVFSWGPQNPMSIESMDRLSCATWKIGTWRQILKTGNTPLESEEKSKWSSQLPGTQKSSSCNILLLKEPPIDDITADAMSLRFFLPISIVI